MIGPRTWRLGTPTTDISITGHFMPCADGKPFYLTFEPDKFVPLFSSVEKLRSMMIMWRVSYDGFVAITDPVEFIASVHEARSQGNLIRLMVDPFVTAERGTIRFKEVLL